MIYFVIFCIVILFFLKYPNSVKANEGKLGYYLILSILIGLCTFRFRVGGDSLHYFDVFDLYPTMKKGFSMDYSNLEYNFGWNFFNSIIKTIYDSFYFFQFIHAIIVNVVIFYIIKRYSINKFFILIFYLFFYFLYFNMEILRECLAIAMFLLSIPSLLDKKWYKYYLFCLLALSFHSSAAILFVLPLFLIEIKLKYQALILVSVAIGVNFLSVENLSNSLLGSYEAVNRANRAYFSLETSLVGIIIQLMKIIPVYLILRVSAKNKFQHPLVAFLTPYLVIGVLSVFIPGVYRFLNYLAIPVLIFIIDFFYVLLRQRKKIFIRYVQIFTYISILIIIQLKYFTRDMSMHTYDKQSMFFNIYTPYHSIIDEKRDRVREDIFYNSMEVH